MPFVSPQSLMLPRIVNVNPAIARGNQSLKAIMRSDSNANMETKGSIGPEQSAHSLIP